MAHPFGDLLREYRARKAHLSLTRLSELAGYDPSMVSKMAQGRKELTGPSGRERVVRLLAVLRDEGALSSLDEANALLKAGGMPPLYEGQPAEASLAASLREGIGTAKFAALPASAPGGPAATAPVTHPNPPGNLPAQLTSFIGRTREIAEVTRLLGPTRLLTLTGAGGCGKTRLAIEVVAALVWTDGAGVDDRHGPLRALAYPDGIWLVELASVTDPDLVANTLAATLSLPGTTGTVTERLVEYLRHRRVLILLDNCEHLIQACAKLAEALLRGCPELHLLATSREGLNIPGEVAWRVPSLAVNEASRLFLERARVSNPRLILTEHSQQMIEEISIRLDGMPLALELAAARLRMFSLEQLAARLDDRFSLLTRGMRTALPRQQTLRATIDWSYELLTADEQELLGKLSVFANGWTLEVAEAVCGDVMEPLSQLVDKSLVVAEETQEGVRYRLLETIRQYAHEKLTATGEYPAIQDRHLAYFTHLAQEVEPKLGGPEQRRWLDLLETEHDNLRAALGWAAHDEYAPVGAPLALALSEFWRRRSYGREGIAWLKTLILDRSDIDPCWRLKGLHGAIGLGELMMDPSLEDWRRELWDLAQRVDDTQLVLMANVLHFWKPGDTYEQILNSSQAAIHAARQAGQTHWVAWGLFDLGWFLRRAGNTDSARAAFQESIDLLRQLGDVGSLGGTIAQMGILAYDRGDWQQARACYEEGLAMNRQVGCPTGIADLQVELATVALHQGDRVQVRASLKEAIELFRWIGNLERLAQCVCVAAGLAHVLGRVEDAIRLLASTSAWHLELFPWQKQGHITFQEEYDRLLESMRTAVDPAAFTTTWAEGRAMALDQAVESVLVDLLAPLGQDTGR